MIKKFFLFCAAVVLLLGNSYGAVKVSRLMLKNGSAIRTGQESSAVMECLLENPDAVPHTVELLLHPAEKGFQEENINSWQVFLPAKSSIYFRGSGKIGKTEKYELTVYCDKVRQARTPDNATSIKLQSGNEKMTGIWNDSGNIPSSFSKHPLFKDKMFSIAFGKNSFPLSARQLSDLAMLIIVRPDFEDYTAKDFSLVLEYAANGGRVLFVDPQGIYKAAETPLEVMLPVMVLGVKKTGKGDFLSRIWKDIKIDDFGDGKEAELLQSIPGGRNGISFAEYEKMPLFREGKFGSGVVSLLAFSPDDEAFGSHSNLISAKALSLLCAVPAASAVESSMHTPLDMLTGFSVLPLSVVRNIILIYFVLLAAVLLAAHFLKKQTAGWLLCGVIAIAFAGTVMYAAAGRTGKKITDLTASVTLTNSIAPGSSRSSVSRFTSAETICDITGEKGSSFAMLPPPKNVFGTYSGRYADRGGSSFYRIEPVKATRNIRGQGGIQMTVFPKSSKRYTVVNSPADLFVYQKNMVLPQLILTKDEMLVSPWKLPQGEKAECIFYIFPGKPCAGTVSSEGICSPELAENMLLSDPMTEALQKSTDLLERKNAPLLAAVFPMEEKNFSQGKKIMLYPVNIKVKEKEICIPSALVGLHSANHTSRMLFEGGRIRKDFAIMVENPVEILFSLPGFCRGMIPEEITIKVEYTGKEYITLAPVLKLPGKNNFIKGRKLEGENTFVFKGEDLEKVLDLHRIAGTVVLKSSLNETGTTLNAAGMRQFTWNLYKLDVSVKGKLPEKTAVPFVY